MKRSTLIALLLSGCYSAQPIGEPLPVEMVEYEFNGWLARKNPAGTCREEMGNLRLVVTEQEELQSVCQSTAQLWGCLVGDVVYLNSEAVGSIMYEKTIAHELRHWFGACSFGVSDETHESPSFWYPDLRTGQELREERIAR